jgi:hypothetical protein
MQIACMNDACTLTAECRSLGDLTILAPRYKLAQWQVPVYHTITGSFVAVLGSYHGNIAPDNVELEAVETR